MNQLDDFPLTSSNIRNLRHNFYKLLELEEEYDDYIWNVIDALDDLAIILKSESR